jgi:hypothetical protein
MVYLIDMKDQILWSKSKMDATYKHVEFLFRDRVRFKEMTEKQFSLLKKTSKKKFFEIQE